MNKLNNIGWFFGAASILVLSSACGQSVTVAPKAPITGETIIDVPSLEERAAAIQAAAYDRPSDAVATPIEKMVHVSNHRKVVDEEPASKMFRAIMDEAGSMPCPAFRVLCDYAERLEKEAKSG